MARCPSVQLSKEQLGCDFPLGHGFVGSEKQQFPAVSLVYQTAAMLSCFFVVAVNFVCTSV